MLQEISASLKGDGSTDESYVQNKEYQNHIFPLLLVKALILVNLRVC
jgi:hypothetical protein